MLALRFKYAASHLFISLIIASCAACLVFFGWYKSPYHALLNVGKIYFILIIIDVMCGPLLTLMCLNPKKNKPSFLFDLSIIGLIQLFALLYGLYSLYEARPVMIVFEKDRFVLVQANEVQVNEFNNTPDEFKPLKHIGTRMASTREPKSRGDILNSIESSLGGVDISFRPSWWANYDEARPTVKLAAHKISELIDKYPTGQKKLESKLISLKIKPEKALYLPFVSSKNYNWIAILDENADIKGYLNLSEI